jgi:hypothetical protein
MAEIQRRLLEHQKRQKLGDRVAPMSELARRADVHHSTLYQALHGERVDNRTQLRLSRMLEWLASQPREPASTRIWHVALGGNGAGLQTGLGAPGSLFSTRKG